MIKHTLFLASLLLISLQAAEKEIDLVAYGEETFQSLGCAECHSSAKDDPSVKTGPGLYGLLQKEPRSREVLSGGERHHQEVQADLAYLTQSVRKPLEDLALYEKGDNKDQPYLPVMPPYNEQILSDFKLKAIYQYLLTLNDEGARGPAQVMAAAPIEANKPTVLKDDKQILVTDRTRIYRTRVKGQSARAVYVGTPVGLNYVFDPISLSVEKIWWGGFLNIRGSLDGRGQKPSRYGHMAQQVDLPTPLLAPLHPKTGEPVDLSFKSPRMADFKTIAKTLNSEEDFADQLAEADASFLGYEHAEAPTFHFQVGENVFQMQLTVSAIGEAKLTLGGTLKQPQTFRLAALIKGQAEDWTVKSLPAELTFTIPVKPAWRPSGVTEAPRQQPLKESANSKIQLPPGYQASQIAAPTDIHGRNQLFEPLGMTHGPDGTLIVATRTAGIWTLKEGYWTQVAEGLQDCLGVLREEDGSLIVGQKPELTRLSDLDGDGWYDFYQTLSEDFLSSTNYHEYLHGPAKGSDGNYYFTLNLTHHNQKKSIYKAGGKFMGTQGGYRGWAMQVTPAGETTPFANGLRSPSGLATGPDGQLYYTENQGEYVGTSKLFRLEKNKFYGHPSGLVDLPGMKPSSPDIQWSKMKSQKEKALALFAHSRIANAPGSPTWAPGADVTDLFVGDQTLSTLFEVHLHPEHEAAVVPFGSGFPSGLMRLLFDGPDTLYVGQTGRGWRAQGGSQFALVKITRTEGGLANHLKNITRNETSFTLDFSDTVDTIPTAEQLKIESWTYLDAPNYGSPENDKTEHRITAIKPGAEPNQVTVTIESLAKDDKNRVLSFTSSHLPPTKGKLFEAFYSVVGK